MNEFKRVEVTLDVPVKHPETGDMVTLLWFHEPNVADMETVEEASAGRAGMRFMRVLLQQLLDEPSLRPIIPLLHLSDFGKAATVIGPLVRVPDALTSPPIVPGASSLN